MTLTQLRSFLEVCRTRNFTAAAANLYVSQSSLSYAISGLEKELEAPLFIRRPNRGIELTEYGRALLSYAEAGIKLLDDGAAEVANMRNPLRGTVNLGFFFSVSFTVVPYLLQQFRKAYPDHRIEIETEVFHNWTDLSQELRSGRMDLVLSAGNLSEGCASTKVAEHRIVLTVPRDHRLAAHHTVSVRDLAHQTLIAFDPNSNMDQAIKAMFAAEHIVPCMVYVPDWTSQQLAVLSGKGLGLSMDVPADERYLAKVEVANTAAVLPLYLTWATDRKLSQATMYVRDRLLEIAREIPIGTVF